jgi:8-oxo-dGTP diphosphatase
VNILGTAKPYLAAFVILRKDGKFASLLRSNTGWMDGYYGLPAGKVEKGESAVAAAIREAKEEAGVIVKDNDLEHTLTLHRYDKDNPAKEWIDIFFVTDKWQGNAYNAEPEVHGELVWLDSKKLPDNMTPYIHAAVEAIDRGETYLEYGW